MAKYVRQFDYGNFRSMDCFFSNGKKPHNYVVRFACAVGNGLRWGFRAAKSKDYVDHAGFSCEFGGQLFPVEQTPKGMRQTSFEEYRTKSPKIIDMYRWNGWNNKHIRALGLQDMALKIRKNHEVKYDWWGAFTSSWLGKKIFRHQKQDPNKTFCSEDVIDTILKFWHEAYGVDCPLMLPKTKNPQAVREWMHANPEYFSQIVKYEVPA